MKNHTQTYQRHTTCSFGYKVICHYDKKYAKDIVIYRGDNTISKFINCMFEELHNFQKLMIENFNKPLKNE